MTAARWFERRSPRRLSAGAELVGEPREREEQIGESVEIDDHELRDLRLLREEYDAAFGATADGSRNVKRRGLCRTAGHDERLQRFEIGVAFVDRVLELRDASFVQIRLLEMLAHLHQIRCCEERADREQIRLDWSEYAVETRQLFDGDCHSDGGVQLIDVTVCLDARMALRDAPASEESRVAVVAGLRIDLHGDD